VAPYRAGIPVQTILILAFVLSGALAGFAGWLLAARADSFSANMGIGMLFDAFAGVLAGALLLSTIGTAITVMRIPVEFTLVIKGALVLFAVMLDSFKLQLRRRYLHG